MKPLQMSGLELLRAIICAARSGCRGGRPHGPRLAQHRNLGRYTEIPRREAARDGDGNLLFEEKLNTVIAPAASTDCNDAQGDAYWYQY
jgi:hypothetical protein